MHNSVCVYIYIYIYICLHGQGRGPSLVGLELANRRVVSLAKLPPSARNRVSLVRGPEGISLLMTEHVHSMLYFTRYLQMGS